MNYQFSFHIGNIEVSAHNINELRELAQELTDKLNPGEEYSKHINDFIFDVEYTYQRHHKLDSNNWDMIHN